MATEFICAVGPGQADYTSSSLWEAGTQCDYTAADTLVFGGTRTGTIADDASVTGSNSGATGTVVHCTSTQILIESISGTFQSGEQIEADTDNYFTTSDAGDSAIGIGECATTGAIDSTAFTFTGATTDSSNYRELRAASGHESLMTGWDSNRYRLETNRTDYGNIELAEDYAVVDGLQIFVTSRASGHTHGFILCSFLGSGDVGCTIRNCRIETNSTTTGNLSGIWFDHDSGSGIIENTIVCSASGAFKYGVYTNWSTGSTIDIYNCIFEGCTIDAVIEKSGGDITIKNSAVFNNTDDFDGVNTVDYCASDDGDGSNQVQPTDWGEVFTDYANGDFSLLNDATALADAGIGPDTDGDASVPTEDMAGNTRSGQICDIGVHEYTEAATTSVSTSYSSTVSTTASTSLSTSGSTTASTSLSSTVSTSGSTTASTSASSSLSSTVSTSASTSLSSTASTSGSTSQTTYTLPPPDALYTNESWATDGAQDGHHNPTGIEDTAPIFSARVYPDIFDITDVYIQVSLDPDFDPTDGLDWDSGWMPLGTDAISPNDEDTDGGVRTIDIRYGEGTE